LPKTAPIAPNTAQASPTNARLHARFTERDAETQGFSTFTAVSSTMALGTVATGVILWMI